MKKYGNEFKVGLFVILCLLGFFYLTYSTGKLDIKKKGYNIYVVFDQVAGLQNKAPVMLNGLEVGKVEDIRLSYDQDSTKITLRLWLDSAAKVRENPEIAIKTLGLMGEKYIQISSTEGENFIQPEAVVIGKPYVDLDALMASVNTTLDANKDSIGAIIKNFESTSKNFEEFSADVKRHPWKLLFRTKEKPQK